MIIILYVALGVIVAPVLLWCIFACIGLGVGTCVVLWECRLQVGCLLLLCALSAGLLWGMYATHNRPRVCHFASHAVFGRHVHQE